MGVTRWLKQTSSAGRLASGAAGSLTALLLVFTACAPNEEEIDTGEAASTRALNELFPNAADRAKVEAITAKLWEGLQPHGCMSCHSTPDGPGWEAAKMPYYDYWKSSVLVHLDLVDRETSTSVPTNFKLYRQLSGEVAPVMPPRPEGSRTEEGAAILDAVEGFGGALQCTGNSNAAACRHQLREALGGAPVYTNRRNVCIDNARLEQVHAPSLCETFAELSQFITTWKGSPQAGVQAWLDVVKKAATIGHYDSAEGVIPEDSDNGGPSGPIQAGGGANIVGKGRVLLATPRNSTISFYTRVAPDDSAIAFTQTGPANFMPKIIDLPSLGENPLSEIRYDPTFSPDYSLATKKGFMVGAKGVASSETQKYYSFFAPGTRGRPFATVNLGGISGYGTIAHITAANADSVAPSWKKVFQTHGDYYVIMGKRWKWFAVKTVADASGATTNIKILKEQSVGLPGGTAASTGVADAVCRTTLTDATGRDDRQVAFAESMLSNDGRFIALNSQRDGALLLVNTKTCTIEHAPMINGEYVRGSKAAFSMDGNLVTFHAFGEDGLSPAENGVANNGAIRNLAERGRISNIFVYDTRTKETKQVTDYKRADKTIAWFPNFNGDASKIYYHRHRAGQTSSEVMVVEGAPR